VTEISEVTRRSIVDFFTMSQTHWSGRLQDNEFLARLYDLNSLPSHDYRYRTASSDIFQHRVRNSDWENDWVFHDSRFNLLYESDEEFLRFLCETVHPIVRPDPDDARKLVEVYNKELAPDGWVLVGVKEVSGKPIFAPQQVGRVAVFEEPTGWQKVDRQLQEVRLRLDAADNEEQYQAVGLLCREVLISVAQEVYDPALHPTIDGVAPSTGDAKRMLEAIFESDLKGSESKEARAHARAAVNLSLALQHKRTADFRMAALCAEGTLSVVNMLAILAGRRGRPPR
jgi:AbiJ N-terminal domain 3